jgi:UDP-N-acetyl-D-mannosaminuronic acid dehydrogenase
MTTRYSTVSVIGGAGHVGLPLAIMAAQSGFKTHIIDVDLDACRIINSGKLPFYEPGAEPLLKKSLDEKLLDASGDASLISNSEVVIIVIGTPVDEHLNPDPNQLPSVIRHYLNYFRDGQLVILRSTIFPGVTRKIAAIFKEAALNLDVCFCPERIAEHNAIEELRSLPQIVSGVSAKGEERARNFFSSFAKKVVTCSPEEAELAKLFTNSWRYIKFAAANQFYMMAASNGIDFETVRRIIVEDYPRASDLPSAGLAAGPCLLKDTMQLAAFSDNTFLLGHGAMMVNEGLPLFMIRQLERKFAISELTIAILGMSFKSMSDDIRDSLSYKLKKLLEFRAKNVICVDEHVNPETVDGLSSLSEALDKADLFIIATPHPEFRNLSTNKPIFDIWGVSSGSSVFR